jgi:aspartyl-tRNA(Asn)/glutamyl-tRNA(Gln) amidotransferase subunit A
MTTEPALMSAEDLLRHYRRRTLSPVEAVDAVLARIATAQPVVNAFVLLDAEGARAAARQSEARWQRGTPMGPLDGVPSTIKDLALTRGWPTLRGSRAIDADQPWQDDAPVTARMREAGAILLGKTTTPEFGWKGVTDSALTGITRNPWDVSRTSGGSSGGAAVAAALGLGALHSGSDGGGSIRIPAGFTGIFGHKPSFGRVPAWPPSPFGSLSHTGPMTRTVGDAALMLTVIAAPDARDWSALPHEPRDWRIGLEAGVAGLRIAYSPDLGHARVDPEVRALVDAAARVFEELGAHVEEATPPLGDTGELFRRFWYPGAAALVAGFAPERSAVMEAGLLEVARAGAEMPLVEVVRAQVTRAEIGTAIGLFHQRYDLLLTPTLPIPAFPAGQELADPSRETRWIDWTPFSYPFNLTQQPAATVPCGLTAAGLPVGLQIVGPMHDDALVLRAARAFESARPFRMPRMPAAA